VNGIAIWTGAAVLYVAFRLWYDGRRRPLSAPEIDAFLAKLEGTPAAELNDLAALRAFLERDDGREFVMLNLVKLNPEPAPHPVTGEPLPAQRLLREYIGTFLSVVLRGAGHPVLQAAKIGPYLDAWNVEPDPGWTMMGSVRYRSRRDMMKLATHPRFLAGHPFKAAALSATYSFPTSPGVMLYVGPRVWVALVLALGAALVQLATS
jgi:hypothetical protein